MKNPLLQFNQLPQFNKIKVAHIEPALDAILLKNRQQLKTILSQKSHLSLTKLTRKGEIRAFNKAARFSRQFSWENLMQPLEAMEDHLDQLWSTVEHLHSVADNEKLRKVYHRCLPKLSKYYTEMAQNKKLYQAILSLKNSKNYSTLDPAQKQVIKNQLRDFKLAGVALSETKKKQFAKIVKQLSKLTTQFEENVLDATHAWSCHITDKKQLSGLPEHIIESAHQLAKSQKKKGWIFTLDFPVYYAVMTYADDANFRGIMYEAFSTRASDQGPNAKKFDNASIMKQIINLRFQLAKLIGFKNFADYSLAKKMAKNSKTVLKFLNDLLKHSKPHAKNELKKLEKFFEKPLQIWDMSYASEKLRKEKFKFSQEELRLYFPENQVIQGLFQLTEKMYRIKINEKRNVNIWHSDVRYFEIRDQKQNLIGGFYTDLYARPHKRGGAWMADCRGRRLLKNKKVQLPIAYLNCNFHKPANKKPTLLTHEEIQTLFHEFGHCLHHLLTKVNYYDVSGINGVPWDGVEVPSQMMEYFCWDKKVLRLISKHIKTGKKLPDSLYKNLIASKNFQSGFQMARQISFGIFDFKLHLAGKLKNPKQIQTILNNIRKQINIIKTPVFNRFQNSFTHIFSGGYAAGYYSYKWAEVLACDAFEKFKKDGLWNRKTCQSFLENVLSIGGSQDFMTGFIKFRGRKPNIKALLKNSGLSQV